MFKVDARGKETALHKFAGGTTDGCYPEGNLVMDAKGNLYGTTSGCGTYSWGTVWKLSSIGILTLLHSFSYDNYATPTGGVTSDEEGNLYGTTYTADYGTVWEFSLAGTLTVLHAFSGGGPNGVIRDAKGNLYGTTLGGGGANFGTVWKLTP